MKVARLLRGKPPSIAATGPTAINPAHIAVAYVAFTAATELTFRTRSLQDALQGAVDAQVVVEIAVVGLILGWVLATVMRKKAEVTLLSLRHLGPSLRGLIVVTIVVFVSSLYAPSVRSIVKALEFVELSLLTVFAFNALRSQPPQAIVSFWKWSRRWIWWMTGVAIIVTALAFMPLREILSSFTQTHLRFHLMAAHPIVSGAILGVSLLALFGTYLAVHDQWSTERRHWLLIGASLALLALLTATKARGALLAMVAGAIVLTVTTPNRHKRRLAVLLVWGALALPFLGVGDQALTRTLIRNQTIDQLASLSDRTLLFEAAWPLVLENPIFGHGYLATASVFPDLFPWAGEGHNVVLEAAFSFGLVGVIAFLVLWVQIGRQLLLAVRSGSPEVRAVGNEISGLAAFLLVLAVVGDSFAGIPGLETVGLMWVALFSDLLPQSLRTGARPSSR